MAFETKLYQKMSQSVLMTPQLQQAIKLLQLGRLEYIEAIEKELLENPLLEEFRDEDFSGEPVSTAEYTSTHELAPDVSEPQDFESRLKETTITEWENYIDQFHDSVGSSAKGSYNQEDFRNSYEENIARHNSLEEDLLEQVRLLDLSAEMQLVLQILIGSLDRKGFLPILFQEVLEIIQTLLPSAVLSDVEEAHQILISLEPVGVGARNLQECLFIQLDKLGLLEGVEGVIIRDHFDLLEKGKVPLIAKKIGVSTERIQEALQRIHLLDPFPARQYLEEATRYIVPDVYVYRVAGEYHIVLNDEGLPKLRINPYYRSLLKSEDGAASKGYLNDMVKSATWLIKSIDQRQRTIYRVTESIVRFQRDFFDYGIEHLKPLVLKEIADDIEMHESTVSRITSNKYVHTPQGIFELKYFFTSAIKTAFGEVSSSSVKEKIRQLIANESPDAPVSDQKIVDVLKAEKMDIARRTVAKYRESMGIPASSRRKR
jgi:RNA polymerase sigma-54 factor